MDDDDTIIFLFLVAAAHQLICSFYILFNDVPTAKEKKREIKCKRELTSYKRNVSCRYSTAAHPLVAKNSIPELLHDPNRAYIKSVTHLHEWQFFILAEKLKELILHPRLRSDGTRPVVHCKPHKFDHCHHLLFVLHWLNDGLFYRSREADTGYAKSSVHEDLVHVLQAIVEGLHEHLTWPDGDCRHELAEVFPGILRGCIGVGDVKEYEIEKPKNSLKEKLSWSGKKKL
jgi:hypothetical protein